MAGALVGGAFVSGFINVVLDRLISPEAANLVVGKKLSPDLVERLKSALTNAGYLVDDAELKQLENHEVKDWLNSLRDAVYTADDLLDRVCTKAATQNRVRSFLPSFLNPEERQMVNDMERVVRRIEDLEKRKDYLGLQKISTSSFSWKTPSTSLVRGNVYGREDDREALVKMLNDKKEDHLTVISIVGMGGVGKTTLAQYMYNNPKLMEGFDLKAWACISEHFNVVETTKDIVKEIRKNTQDLGSFNSIQDALKEELSKKKFFIVLDDVWSDDHHQWKNFLAPFRYGAKGSIILLTTRLENVASVIQTNDDHLHRLEPLSEDYCWSVFAANASFPESNGNPTLEGIGKEIARKCDGLPLAAETLGCLCRRHDAEEWEKILRSDIWGFSIKDSKIIPALLVSYYQLPSYLKRCFVYCSLFPKDYEFGKDELILLWMAEDLLRPPNRGESLEEVGCKGFEELTSRLFFKPHENISERFVMHDLLHDLAIFLAGDFYCRIEELREEQEEKKVLTHHFSHFERRSLGHPISKVFDSTARMESLRTSLYLEDLLIMESMVSKFKYLRVLSFRKLDVLPDSIGELIHLRYLNLSGTDIDRLPESLCKLYNLQTLILYGCTKLTMLPNGMHNLVNLKHLDLRNTSLEEFPGALFKCKTLRIDYFVVGKNEDNGIQELGGLLNLHGSLHLKKLENIVDAKEAENARMINKNLIDELYLEWSSGDDMVSNAQTERDILDSLQPHNGLKVLTITEYKGTIFPNWVGHSSYNKMTSVYLESCNNCFMLPSLGLLPSLKKLRIQGFSKLMSVGMEFYKNEGDHHSSPIAPFPALKNLEFRNMPLLEEWYFPDPEAFPQLRSLEIEKCEMLKEDILGEVLTRTVSPSSDVSKVRKLEIKEDFKVRPRWMVLDGDTLSVRECGSLMKYALKGMIMSKHLCCLQEISISDISCSVSLRGNLLPKSLQILNIRYSGNLELVQQDQKYNLAELTIVESCSSLTSLSLDAFPNLRNLEIYICSTLEFISTSDTPHAALQSLTISECHNLVSFTKGGLAIPNLTHLYLACSYSLTLPSNMNTLLPNLHTLEIFNCRKIRGVPEGGLPPNLKHLYSGERFFGGLLTVNLEALTDLSINGASSSTKSFPDSLPHLPSLTTLKLHWFYNLETLECNQLLRLTSLQEFHIKNCCSLRYIQGEKLPSSLLLLKIEKCDLLGEECKKKHQQIWPKIEHIPTILVDGQQIV